MNIFRQLRWQLTISYTLVTVCALLVITLILGGGLLTRIFLPVNIALPVEEAIDWFMHGNAYNLISQLASASPVDSQSIHLYLQEAQSMLGTSEILRIGSIRLWISANPEVGVAVIGKDGTLLGSSFQPTATFNPVVGEPFDPSQLPGLEVPYQAALAGVTNPERLYTWVEPNKRVMFAGPLFDRLGEDPTRVVGVIVIELYFIPTEEDLPSHILKVAGRSLVIFLLGAGIMGALFGTFFAHGLSTRFKRISAITDQWSAGDFSRYIGDATGDEIAQFTRRLDNMAEQLQSLLRRRQDMAVSEERNRLARDLHDSAKQQALAASFELGTALTLFERNSDGAKKHLVEADALVDSVRNELTNLVDELRPQPIDDKDFASILKEHALDWSHRSGIEINLDIEEHELIPLALRETLYRILQEALANIARHSSATCAHIYLQHGTNTVTMTVTDNGAGFDTNTNYSGIGLNSMRERAEVLDGHFTVESAPGKGTQVKVTLPLKM